MNQIINKIRTNFMWMFFGIAFIAAILSMLGVTTYVAFDMTSLFSIIAVLITAFIIGAVLEVIDPKRNEYVNAGFRAGVVILLLYILQPLINSILKILGL